MLRGSVQREHRQQRWPMHRSAASYCVMVLAAALIWFGGSVPGWAFAGLGLINVPQAETVDEGEVLLSARVSEGAVGAAVVYGLSDSLQLGVSARDLRAGRSDELSPSLQLHIHEETANRPALAVGYRQRYGFLGLSRQLGKPGLRAHFGARGNPVRPYAGLSYVLNPVQLTTDGRTAPLVRFMGEYDGEYINAGAKVETRHGLYGELAWLGEGRLLLGVGWRASF